VTSRTGTSRDFSKKGAIAQLGERLNGIQEVRGSTPLGSTRSLALAVPQCSKLSLKISIICNSVVRGCHWLSVDVVPTKRMGMYAGSVQSAAFPVRRLRLD
jgi:hypothetical protein